jgi:predicted dehydrogenase
VKLNRRKFIAGAAGLAAGAAGLGAAQTPKPETQGSNNNPNENLPGGETWNRDPGIRRKDEKLLRIGGVFGLWSHTSSTWWRYLNPPEGYARTSGMRITHVFCIDPEAGKRLAQRYDAQFVSRYDGMVGQVDGMFIDDFQATPFMPDLALPYLEAGIPCLFDRPMASSVAGALKVINASKRSNTPFMAPSAYEYLKEIEVTHTRLKNIGNLSFYEAHSSGTTLYQYVLHGLWFTLKAMGADVERIAHRTVAPVNASGLTSLEHRRDGKLFYGSIHHSPIRDIMVGVHAYGSQGDFEAAATNDGRPWHHDVYTYLEMVHAMERMIRTRKAPEPLEYTEKKVRIFLALLHSVFEKNGEMVEVASLPETWDAGFPKGYRNSYSDEIIAKYRQVLRK